MKELLRLAFRNLWRHRRRTLLTVTVYAVGLGLVIVTNTIMNGSHEKTIEDGVRRTSGYLQIHYRGYQENQILYNSLETDRIDANRIRQNPDVEAVLFRITTNALAESAGQTRLVQVLGLDAEAEHDYGGLAKSLTSGQYLSESDAQGVYVGDGLAAGLRVQPGDSIFLIGEGRVMSVAAGKLTIRGVFHTGNADIDRSFLLMNRSTAADIFDMRGFVTSVAVMLKSSESLDSVEAWLRRQVTDQEEVLPWQRLIPELVQFVDMDSAFGYLMLIILVLVIVFGLMNTILTSTMERSYEFAVILATGAPRSYLFRLVTVESFFLSLLSVATGLLLGLAGSYYFIYFPIPITGDAAIAFEMWGFEPMIYGRLSPSNLLGSGAAFLVFGISASIWPAWIASKTDILKNLAGRG